jgi:hypothetical protein
MPPSGAKNNSLITLKKKIVVLSADSTLHTMCQLDTTFQPFVIPPQLICML